MNTTIKLLAASALATLAGAAVAVPSITATAGQTTSMVSGACIVDFGTGGSFANNSACATYANTTAAGVNTSTPGALLPGQIVTGNISGVAAQPVGSTGNYLTVSPGSGGQFVAATGGSYNYFGFLAGSLDPFNAVSFYRVTNGIESLVYSATGTQLAAAANLPATGNQGQSIYWEINLGNDFFNQIRLSSTSNAFETDNHAFGVIPAPGGLLLLGIGALGLAGCLRRKQA